VEAGVLMRGREGFTLIEMLIALVMMSFILVGLAGVTGRLSRSVDTNERKTLAVELAEDKIAEILIDADYDSLDVRYEGTDYPLGFTRTVNDIVRTGGKGKTNDYKKITITVSGPGLSTPIIRSTTVAAP
jgi:prepilin-type N-terminal cleavage/methylation domain-containing protein